MANVAHSTLTGADLHEPKGVAAASSGTVYVANGSGSGAWTAHSTFGGAFGGKFTHLRDQVSSGTAAQSLTGATWNTVRLQTEVTDDIGVTLSSNQFSLASGTYIFNATSFYTDSVGALRGRLRLRNITAGSDLLYGPASYGSAASGGTTVISMNMVQLRGRFVLGGTVTVELQKYVGNSGSGGFAQSLVGYDEIYSELMIWKVA
jgi:hypothetical protein